MRIKTIYFFFRLVNKHPKKEGNFEIYPALQLKKIRFPVFDRNLDRGQCLTLCIG